MKIRMKITSVRYSTDLIHTGLSPLQVSEALLVFLLSMRVNLKCFESVDSGTSSCVDDGDDRQDGELHILIKEEKPKHDDFLCELRLHSSVNITAVLFTDISCDVRDNLFVR